MHSKLLNENIQENILICQLKQKWASWVAEMVKNLSAVWETWVLPLGQEDPLEKDMATHSSILAQKIPWTGFHGQDLEGYSPWGCKELDIPSMHTGINGT